MVPRSVLNPRPLLTALAATVAATSAFGHVGLDKPNGGEVLNAGDTFTTEWQVLISHALQNWDLWYSTVGSTGPWIVIANDLPAGSGLVGSVHTFDWTIPDTPSTNVYVRVRMDNTGTDYYDTSDAALTIIGTAATDCNGNGVPDVDDIAAGTSADFDADGVPDECQSLSVDVDQISLGAGGTQTMTLDAGAAYGGDFYFVAGTLSGTSPGTPFGGVLIPLNYDIYTGITLSKPNQLPLVNTFALLDGAGLGSAKFDAPAGLLGPGLAGVTLHHAYVVLGPGTISFVSNPMPLNLMP